jgi:hypothetical protein
MTILFQDSFESGTLTVWQTWSTGYPTVVSTPTKTGSYAISCAGIAGSTNQSIAKDTGGARTTVNARMYFMLPTSGPENIGVIMAFYAPNPTGGVLDVGDIALMEYANGQYQIGVYNQGGPTYLTINNVTITPNVWHYLEEQYLTDATAGHIEVWLDGVSLLSWNGNTGTSPITTFAAGWISYWAGQSTGSSSTLHIDDIVISDTYIGPSSGGNDGGITPLPSGRLCKGIVAYASPVQSTTANFIASHFDIVDVGFDMVGFTAIKTANPNIVMIGYEDIMASHTWYPDWAIINTHEDWFIHDANGGRIKNNQFGWFMMDVGNVGWQAHYANRCSADLNSFPMVDGIFADDVTPSVQLTWGGYSSTIPSSVINRWDADMAAMVAYVKQGIGNKLLIVNTIDMTGQFLANCDGQMYEGFIHPPWAALYDYNYQGDNPITQIGYIETLSATGKIIWVLPGTVLPANPTSAQLAQEQSLVTYTLACALLGYNANSKLIYDFQSDYGGTGSYWPETDIHLGTPSGQKYSVQTNLWARDFANGKVFLNVDKTNTLTVNVAGTNYSMPPHSGLIVENSTPQCQPGYHWDGTACVADVTPPIPNEQNNNSAGALIVLAVAAALALS